MAERNPWFDRKSWTTLQSQQLSSLQKILQILQEFWCQKQLLHIEIRRDEETWGSYVWKENLPAIPGITKVYVATHFPEACNLQLHQNDLDNEITNVSYCDTSKVPSNENMRISVCDWVLPYW